MTERREAEPVGGFGVLHVVPERRRPSIEAYQWEVYPVIHAIPFIVGGFACCEDSVGRNRETGRDRLEFLASCPARAYLLLQR